MSTDKEKDAKTDLQRRFLIGSSLAFAGTAASGVLTGCGGGNAAAPVAPVAPVGPAPPAQTPTFAPVAGAYSSAQSVTIASATPGATIHFTTDGTTPTMSSTVYGSAIPVSTTTTVQAVATASGYQQSNVGSAEYTIGTGTMPLAATPTFTPVAGGYSSAQTVAISCATSGATIYYTTDGSTPTTSSSQYSSPLTVSSTETVKAIATASGHVQSAVGTASYTISDGTLTAPANLQVINQGGPNNGQQGFYSFLTSLNSVSTSADANYQGLSWLAATPGSAAISKYNIYRNGILYDSIDTPITITGYIAPGTNAYGAKCGILTVTAVSGGKTSIADGLILPGLKLTSSASGFVAGTTIVEYTPATVGGGGAGTYTVNFSQTCGSSGAHVTFTGWSYNDTASTNCNVYNFTAPSTVYSYAVTAVDANNIEGPPAHPSAYMYQGISQTQNAQFSYGGVGQNFADTGGSPVNGPYDCAVTFPTGGGGFQPVWAGAGSDTNGCLCPVQHFECGAFKYYTFDIKFTDNTFQTNYLELVPIMRAYGVLGGVDGPHWSVINVNDYCKPIVNQWVTCKIPFSALPYGFLYIASATFHVTAQYYGTLTVNAFGSSTMFGIDVCSYLIGPGLRPNLYTNGNNMTGWPDPKAPYTGEGPWVFHFCSPNIVGNEPDVTWSGSTSYSIQGSSCYKNGFQWAANVPDNTGAFYLNNIGFTTD